MNETINTEKVVDYKARAKRAWQTRRANMKIGKKRGRPRKVQTLDLSGSLELSAVVFSFEQVRELKAAAVTTDGSNYRLLIRKGSVVPSSFFE